MTMTGGIVFGFLAILSVIAWINMPEFIASNDMFALMLLMIPVILAILSITQILRDK